ncbi:MAG: nucleotide sugar dehydrogenase [Anaerolineales bacterium]
MKSQLLQRIQGRQVVVGMVGLGYAGLPLAIEFAHSGLRVIGVDVDAVKVASLTRGESYVGDVPSARVAEVVRAGRLHPTTDFAALREADAIIVCVPTPLRKTREPDLSYIVSAAESLLPYIQPDKLIVLESTTYPGATEEIFGHRLKERGLRVGEDVFLAFSPERVDPGNQRFNMRNTPKVVGGLTPACTEVTAALYALAVDTVVPLSSPRAAEMVKLLENTFRAVNIGLVNEVALMCAKLGVNVWEVIDAAATKPYGFMKFTPGPGIGGHCIPVDPLYLSWKLKALNYTARFIELADEVNGEMPQHVVALVADALNEDGKPLRGSRVLVLGAAYKPDVDDVRESPALDVMFELQRRHALVGYHDPYVPALRLGEMSMHSTPLTPETLQAADCVVLITPHTALDLVCVAENARVIVDTRNAMGGRPTRARLITL